MNEGFVVKANPLTDVNHRIPNFACLFREGRILKPVVQSPAIVLLAAARVRARN